MSVYIVACGGTGGHLAPGVAVAKSLKNYGHQCYLITSQKTIDQEFARKYTELKFIQIPGVGFSLRPLQLFRFCKELVLAIIACVKLFQEIKPNIVMGFGGFNSVAPILCAFILGIPTVLHEANRIPGRCIRVLSRFAHKVYLPEGIYLKGVPINSIKHLGYPLRDNLKKMSKEQARSVLELPQKTKLLVVIGGSQGAVCLNDWVRDHLNQFLDEGVSVFCITGKVSGGVARRVVLAERGINKVIAVPFTEHMSEVLCSADLVVSRAGAGTIAELTNCQVPSILIPYPYSADNHQQANALFFEQQGGCIMMPQDQISKLFQEVLNLIYNDFLLSEFQRNLVRLSRINSLELIVDDMEKMASTYSIKT